jgi:hypothetical protein
MIIRILIVVWDETLEIRDVGFHPDYILTACYRNFIFCANSDNDSGNDNDANKRSYLQIPISSLPLMQ